MKCPRCAAWSDVLETRPGEHLTTRRRRQCANGHRFTTVEIHSAAYGSARQRLAGLVATIRGRWDLWARDTRIVRERAAGASLDALSRRFQLTKGAIGFALKRTKGT